MRRGVRKIEDVAWDHRFACVPAAWAAGGLLGLPVAFAFRTLIAAVGPPKPPRDDSWDGGYPRAALFAFAVALCSYNVLAVIKASIRATQAAAANPGVSGYHVANEVAGASRGVLIAIPAAEWAAFARVSAAGMAKVLVVLAGQVRMAEFATSPRGPKKPQPPRASATGTGHVATARLLKAPNS